MPSVSSGRPPPWCRWCGVEQGHGGLGEVAPVGDLPFVVGFDQDGAGEAEQRGGVGEDADDVGAALDLLVHPLERVGGPDLAPVRGREGGEGEQVVAGARASSSRPWGAAGRAWSAITSNCSWTWAASGWAKMVRIAAATISPEPFGHRGQHVAHEVDPAALPGRAEQHAADRGLQALVGVGDHQLHSVQAAGLQRAQERGPERAVLAVPDVEAEHLPPAVGGHPGGDHHRLGHDPPVDPGLAVGGVEEHVRERGVGQGPVPERRDLLVEVGADPRHLALGDPRSPRRAP